MEKNYLALAKSKIILWISTSLYFLLRGLALSFSAIIHSLLFIMLNALLNFTSCFIPVIFCASWKLNQEYLFFTHNLQYIPKSHLGKNPAMIVSQYGKLYIVYCFPNSTTNKWLQEVKENEMERKDIIFDIETATLDPLDEKAKVICIGLKCRDGEIAVLTEETEKELLQKFWGLKYFEGWFRLIGFNSSQFDIPYLLVRSFKYGIKIPDIKGKSVDLRFVLSYGNKFKSGKLDDYSSLFLGNKFKKINDGATVTELYEKGKWDELTTYCGNDVFLTYKIYERLKQMGIL